MVLCGIYGRVKRGWQGNELLVRRREQVSAKNQHG